MAQQRISKRLGDSSLTKIKNVSRSTTLKKSREKRPIQFFYVSSLVATEDDLQIKTFFGNLS